MFETKVTSDGHLVFLFSEEQEGESFNASFLPFGIQEDDDQIAIQGLFHIETSKEPCVYSENGIELYFDEFRSLQDIEPISGKFQEILELDSKLSFLSAIELFASVEEVMIDLILKNKHLLENNLKANEKVKKVLLREYLKDDELEPVVLIGSLEVPFWMYEIDLEPAFKKIENINPASFRKAGLIDVLEGYISRLEQTVAKLKGLEGKK